MINMKFTIKLMENNIIHYQLIAKIIIDLN